MPYGAFVSLGNGISGLVHISQISQKRIGSVHEVLKEGQKVKAKILNTNDGKVSLSMKALEEIIPDDCVPFGVNNVPPFVFRYKTKFFCFCYNVVE